MSKADRIGQILNTHRDPAGFSRRLVARLVDALVLTMVDVGLIFASVKVGGPGALLIGLLVWTPVSLLTLTVYWAACEGRGGQTIGKRLVGIRVERTGGQDLGCGSAFIRQLAYDLVSLPFCLGLLACLWDPEHRAWHDRPTDTRVVRAKAHARKSLLAPLLIYTALTFCGMVILPAALAPKLDFSQSSGYSPGGSSNALGSADSAGLASDAPSNACEAIGLGSVQTIFRTDVSRIEPAVNVQRNSPPSGPPPTSERECYFDFEPGYNPPPPNGREIGGTSRVGIIDAQYASEADARAGFAAIRDRVRRLEADRFDASVGGDPYASQPTFRAVSDVGALGEQGLTYTINDSFVDVATLVGSHIYTVALGTPNHDLLTLDDFRVVVTPNLVALARAIKRQ